MKFSELKKNDSKFAELVVPKYISDTWTLRHDHWKKIGDRIYNSLFLIHSGGLVAVLSFFGNSEDVRKLLGPKIALICFGLGLVCLGLVSGINYYLSQHHISKWSNRVKKFYLDKLEWEDLGKDDKNCCISFFNGCAEVLTWLCFVLFIVGLAFGLFSLFTF